MRTIVGVVETTNNEKVIYNQQLPRTNAPVRGAWVEDPALPPTPSGGGGREGEGGEAEASTRIKQRMQCGDTPLPAQGGQKKARGAHAPI